MEIIIMTLKANRPYKEDNRLTEDLRKIVADLNDRDKLKEILFSQCIEVGRTLRRKKMYAKTVGILYKDFKFRKSSNQITLDNPINDDKEIFKVVSELFDSTYDDEYIRLIGVRLSNLQESMEKQISIFDEVKEEDDSFQETIDEINNKYGKNVLKPASLNIDKSVN